MVKYNKKDNEVLQWYISEDMYEVIEDPAQNNKVQTTLPIKHIDKHNTLSQSRIISNNCNNLLELKNAVLNFNGCSLKSTTKNTVFADGVDNASIMIIGEAPGQAEDEQGKPFCGASGKLLDSMLKSVGISRETNAYITNCIFWRPPANRRPTEEEIEICKPFLEKHIALKSPKLLLLVGSTSVNAFLGKEYQISNVRKKLFSYSNQYINHQIPVTAIFHPAYLLRQPMKKQDTWYDLLYIKSLL